MLTKVEELYSQNRKEPVMASENETVASVADCIRHLADNLPNGVILNIAQCNFTADRIEAAWRREKAELNDSLKKAINIICGKCYDRVRAKCARGEVKDCDVFRLRKALEGANATVANGGDQDGNR